MEHIKSKFIHGGNFSIQSPFEYVCFIIIVVAVVVVITVWALRFGWHFSTIDIHLHHSHQNFIAMTDGFAFIFSDYQNQLSTTRFLWTEMPTNDGFASIDIDTHTHVYSSVFICAQAKKNRIVLFHYHIAQCRARDSWHTK